MGVSEMTIRVRRGQAAARDDARKAIARHQEMAVGGAQ